ncbi:MAG TPA: hypothetical protein VFZ43_01710 [Anaerolineales bacterium]
MKNLTFTNPLTRKYRYSAPLKLQNGSRVAVIGGGPAGSSFAYFLLDTAERAGLKIQVDVYEPRDFSLPGPKGCNYCAGVLSESLVQNLAAQGLNLSTTVIQRAINSYIWHTDFGNLLVQLSPDEFRIATVFRGGGPRDAREFSRKSFDGHLLSMAQQKGARVIQKRVIHTRKVEGGILVNPLSEESPVYDLLAVASGVNAPAQNLFRQINDRYTPPSLTKTAIREYYLGAENIRQYMGSALHMFLLNIPRLKFGMLIPKGDYVTACLIGQNIDETLIRDFMTAPELRACFPPDWKWDQPVCQCMPRISVQGAIQPYADRVVFIGDVGASRLYKDGIGSAFRAAKSAAMTAVLNGISEKDFKRHYAPICQNTERDNLFGRIIFLLTLLIQRTPPFRKAVLRMAAREQAMNTDPRMGSVLWDTFTGSAAYEDIFLRALHPSFLWDLAVSFFDSNVLGHSALPEWRYVEGD